MQVSTPKPAPDVGMFSFLDRSRSEAEPAPAGELATPGIVQQIMEALAKSDARMEARLNEFSKRLDAFENRIGQTHAAASSSSSTQHSEASLQRHIAKMSCASSEALTLAERAKLARDFQRESAPAGASETSGAHSSAPAPSSAVVGQNDDPAHHRPHGPHGRHSTAALAASQRERYLAKFEKEEIFGKSLDEIEQDNLTQSMRLRQKQG